MINEIIKYHECHLRARESASSQYNLHALLQDRYDPGDEIEMKHSLERIKRILHLLQTRGVPLTSCSHHLPPDPNWVQWTEICLQTGEEYWADEPVGECESCNEIVDLQWFNDQLIHSIVQSDTENVDELYRQSLIEVEELNRKEAEFFLR